MTKRYETAAGIMLESRGREEVIKEIEQRKKIIKQIDQILKKTK